MNIIFFGSDDFALAHLEELISSRYKVLACVTQPGKAKGRGLKLMISPIKEFALKNNITVLQPENLKESNFVNQLRGFAPDLFVVIAYGKFLPTSILEIPKNFAVNVHASLLPRYRGAAPINWAIIHGEKETGITLFKINQAMDAGEIISQKKIIIDEEDNAISLRGKMKKLGKGLLLKTIESIERKQFTLKPQDEHKVSFAPKLTKQLGCIDWQKSARHIHNLVRGLIPWPMAYTFLRGRSLKILSTQVVEEQFANFAPGQIAKMMPDGFVVATGEHGLLIKRIHLESSKEMDAHSFIQGHHLEVGSQLG